MKFDFNKNTLFISYQMGKVSSSSITFSLKNCIQIHTWSGEEPIKYFSSRYTGTLLGRILQTLSWKIRFIILKKKYEHALKKKNKIKMFVGIREPVSRNISGYFQTLNKKSLATKSFNFHKRKFFAHTPHLTPIYWMENELYENFNINILNYKFDRKKGYRIIKIKNKKLEIFLYKHEKINQLEKSIANFLNDKNFKLKRINIGSQKWYSKIYNNFLKSILFEKEYLDLMYNNKFIKHFYTKNEIKYFINKWKIKNR